MVLSEAEGRRIPAQEVADQTQVSSRYMSKVLQSLSDAGLIHSQRGPNGGFWFSGDPETVTLLDVVQAIEPIERIHECPLKLGAHCDTLCPLHQTLDDLARQTEERLGSTTLRSLMRSPVVPLGLTLSSSNGTSNGTGTTNGSTNGHSS